MSRDHQKADGQREGCVEAFENDPITQLVRAIAEGDTSYEKGKFTAYTAPDQLAADLKDGLLKRHAPKQT